MKLKISKRTVQILLGIVCVCILAGYLHWYDNNVDRSGWKQISGGMAYRDFHGKMVTGWQEIDGEHYYFGFDHTMNTHWLEIDGVDYYLGGDGKRVTGWQEIDGNRYYFGKDGVLQTGWVETDGKRCYLNSYGNPVSGWLEDTSGTYYLDESGFPTTGLVMLDSGTYFFGADGRMTTGWQEADGLLRYFLEDGTLAMGFTEVGESTYYFTGDGTPFTGWVEEGEYRYYFHEDGTMAIGPNVIDSKQYYFTPRGIQVVLVNPWNYLPEDLNIELVSLGNWQYVDKSCYESLMAMMDACRAAGLYPYICSSYRTWEEQEFLMNNKIKRLVQEEGYSWAEAPAIARQSVAVPGTSEHQLGLAVDIVADGYFVLDYTQAKTDTQAWLMEHCWEYGFILRYPEDTTEITGIIYEPWHYRYVGVEVSMELRDLGITLEEYLGAVVTE